MAPDGIAAFRLALPRTILRYAGGRELTLIEPLRTLRMLHHSAWLARRWADPAFPAAFPWFGTEAYWLQQVELLNQQTLVLREG